MSSYHDNNHVPTLIAVQNDGATLLSLEANPNSHRLLAVDGITGSDNGPIKSRHDNNHVPILMATSNADGKTPVPVYIDASNNLLIKSS